MDDEAVIYIFGPLNLPLLSNESTTWHPTLPAMRSLDSRLHHPCQVVSRKMLFLVSLSNSHGLVLSLGQGKACSASVLPSPFPLQPLSIIVTPPWLEFLICPVLPPVISTKIPSMDRSICFSPGTTREPVDQATSLMRETSGTSGENKSGRSGTET